MSAWSVPFCTWVGWSGGWISCPSATARHGEDERGFPGWLWFCPSSWLQAVQFQPDHRAGLPYQLVESTGLTTPAHHSEEQCTGYCSQVQDLQEPVAHTEGSESPQEEQLALFLPEEGPQGTYMSPKQELHINEWFVHQNNFLGCREENRQYAGYMKRENYQTTHLSV